MAHQGYDLQLTRYDARGWRATLYPTGMEHSVNERNGVNVGTDALAGRPECRTGRTETGEPRWLGNGPLPALAKLWRVSARLLG
jgi:hypothetical protein